MWFLLFCRDLARKTSWKFKKRCGEFLKRRYCSSDMDFFIGIYEVFLHQPVFNALVWLSQMVPGKDLGIAVIIVTLVVRFASYPVGVQAVRSQKKLAELQPKI